MFQLSRFQTPSLSDGKSSDRHAVRSSGTPAWGGLAQWLGAGRFGASMVMGLMLVLASGLAWGAGASDIRVLEGSTDGTVDVVHSYKATGDHSFAVPDGVTEVEYLVVGGGGAGGSGVDDGVKGTGGGGAGGLLSGTHTVNPGETVSVTVGAGGVSTNSSNGGRGQNGNDSVFDTLTALGGGGGGNYGGTGGDGGSGGGGGGRDSTAGGSGPADQGNGGGNASPYTTSGNAAGGGGGGHSASAADVGILSTVGTDGGAGTSNAITDETRWYAGGGGGGGIDGRGDGGQGGGGVGRMTEGWDGGDGAPNTGGGGGGIRQNGTGGSGGSGIVVVRYTVPENQVITLGDDTVHIYRETGGHNFTVPDNVTEIEYLLVGGGGAGGSAADGGVRGTGGGGAGGVRSGMVGVTPGESLDITVGAGGSSGTAGSDVQGEAGVDSVFAAITAAGGGGGGKVNTAGSEGGSAGGGGGRNGTAGGTGSRGEGNNGGDATPSTTSGEAAGGGGGGGADSGQGGSGQNSGTGGSGLVSNITGFAQWYAGGGGGGATGSAGSGGNGGGGAGTDAASTSAEDGLRNTGGGGGGVRENAGGGAGGSGIVVLRYKANDDSGSAASVSIEEIPQVTTPEAVQVPVQIDGFDGATELVAFVSLDDNAGTLAITDNTGLSLEVGFDSFTEAQSIGFRGRKADVEAALADHVEWKAPLEATEPNLSVDVTEAAAGALYNPDNGHYYKVVDGGTDTTWQEAKTGAEGQSLFGMTGYLATITSAQENDFTANNTSGTDIWIGASDAHDEINDACGSTVHADQTDSEGRWYWVTGPEACSQFWSGADAGSRVVDRFARWDNGEPNNFNDDENFGATNRPDSPSLWNDFDSGTDSANDYLVEFGGLDGETSTALSAGANRTLRAADQIVVDPVEAAVNATAVPVSITFPAPLTDTANDGVNFIAGVSVPIDGGTLSVTADTSNLTLSEGFSGYSNEPAINFSGPRADVVDALNSLEWDAPGTAQSVKLTVSVSENDPNVFFNSVNGHYYKVITSNGISWTDARDSAETETLFGMTGYLATLTTKQENDFAANNTTGSNIWIGASDEREAINTGCAESRHSGQYDGDSPSEGLWHWVTGPEACTQFWEGQGSGSGGAPVNGEFASWSGTGEPNDQDTGGEHFTATNWNTTSGQWNDLANTNGDASGYLVEFGGRANEANTAINAGGTAMLAAAVVSDAPTGVVATADDNNAEVSWETPASDGFSDITEYTVSSEPGGVTCTAVPPQTNCTVDGLNNGTEYSFTVTATNGQGTSAASDASAPVTPGVSYDGGDGSEGSPYQVSAAGQMVQLADDPSAHYVLSEDIDLSGENWPPIGTSDNPFTGSLTSDAGTPRAISGLDGEPVFGEIGAGATVADLTVKASRNADAGDNAGLLADAIRGADGDRATIDNVLVDTDSSISGNDNIGALAGTTEYAEFTGVTVGGNASGNNQVGGVSGTISDSALTDTTVNGDVDGNSNVGSVGGNIDDSDLTNTKTTGGVQGSGSNVGSVGGQINRSANATCVLDTIQADGNVSGGNKTGGVGGSIDGCSVDNAGVTGDVQGEDQTGGIGGDIKNAEIGTTADSTIVVDGNVEGWDGVGGVGGTVSDSTIENATVNGDVVGDSNVGAIVGFGENVTETNTSSSGGISCQADMAGLGTEADACQVTSWTQLASVNDALDRHFELMNDLGPGDADYDQFASATANGGDGWAPLGDSFDNYFAGTFDGQGHVIDGLTIARSAQSRVGLFGRTGDGAIIRNLGLINVDIVADGSVGALIGRASPAEVINSYAEGQVEGSGNSVGGLIGHAEDDAPSITDSHASVTVTSTGNAYVGGLVGLAEGTVISDSHATGPVSLDGVQSAGGLVGEARSSTITDSFAEGQVQVTATSDFFQGGLVGLQEGGRISRSYATGDVSGGMEAAGGLVGYVWSSGIIEDSFATGSVSGTVQIGGLVGWLDNGDIQNTYATGAVSGDSSVGGLVGDISDSSGITDSYVSATVTGGSPVGGLVGAFNNASINRAYYDRTVNPDMPDESHGRTTEELNDFITFDGDWSIAEDPDIPRGYPVLVWESATDYGVAAWFIGTQIFENGSGTSADPFVISNSPDLAKIGDRPDSHFVLDGGADATLDVGDNWQPIGTEAEPFTGSLASTDGNPVTLSGLNGQPVFGEIGPGAEVSDLTIQGSENLDAGDNAGLLASAIRGTEAEPATISNINVDTDSNISGGDFIGGLAGTTEHTDMTGITVDGDVTGNNDVGGVSGTISDSELTDTTVNGRTQGNNNVGAVGGTVTDSSLTNTETNGGVQGSGSNVGSVAGQANRSANATCVLNTIQANGSVKGGNKTGGVGGSIDGCSVSDAQVTGDVEGEDQTGGIGGEINNADISNTTGEGRVDGRDRVGGVVGSITDSTVDSATVNGGVSGVSNVDGIAGESTGSTITNSTANGPVAVTPAAGSGTAADPYQVGSANDLAWVARESDADYQITNDIDLAGVDWDPIGSDTEPFTGSLRSDDGTPRAISGLDGRPLFEKVGPGAEVSDLTIQGSENLNAGDNAGLLANAIRGTEAEPAMINNINVDTDSSISGGDFIGGLAGTAEHADMTGITVDGDVTGNNSVGGVSGAVSDSSLTDTTVNGSVSGTGSETGGVAGRTTNTVVDDTVVAGNVSGGSQVGGVSGTLDGGSASDMTIDGNVSGTGDQVGGVGGRISGADVSGGAINGDVSGNDEVGGIGGNVTDTSLSNSAVNGQVTGDSDNVGAITGTVDDASTIEQVVTDTTEEEDEPLSRVLLDEDGEPLGDGPLATGEEVRIVVDGAVLPLAISGTVTRGTDMLDLQDDSREGVVLSDPDGGDSLLSRRDGDYFFQAQRGGVYELVFEDGEAETFSIEFEVRPQVAFTSTRQLGTSGSSVTVRAVLEGTPAQFPVNVPYEVSNHDLLSASDLDVEGVFSFEEGSDRERIRKLSLTPAADTGEVRVTLKQGNGPEDALLGDPFVHRVVLRQPAELPLPVGLRIEQGGSAIGSLAHRDDGVVTVTAIRPASGEPFEANQHSFDWSRSALVLGIENATGATVEIDPARMTTEDVGTIRVTVTETGGTRRRATAETRLRFIDDDDGESLAALDGFLNDGPASRHQLPICPQGTEAFRDQSERTCNQVDRLDQGIFMEAPESYTLALGSLSDRASWETDDFGLEVSTDEIRDEGSDVTVRDAEDTEFDHLGYRVDFELSDLDFPGQSVPVVVPVPEGEAVPADAVWRKYADGGWRTFVEDEANRLFSTTASAGNCPWPGSDRWTEGLNEGDNCLRLIIQDGGPNDQDGEADGVIRDPGTLAVASSTDGHGGTGDDGGDSGGGTLKSSGGGGGLSSMGVMLFVLAALTLLRHRRVLVLMAVVMAGSAQAETASPWYVGAQLGYGMTDVSSSDINRRMNHEGIAGSARVSDSDRLGGRIFIGYQWHRYIALEAGLVDLGEITTRFYGTDPDLNADDLEDVRPGSGRGLEASVVGRYPLAANWDVLARLGLLRWRTHQDLEGVGADNNNGNDAFFGLGVDYRFHESWSARLSVDRYRVENDDTDFIGLGVSYHFGKSGDSGSEPELTY